MSGRKIDHTFFAGFNAHILTVHLSLVLMTFKVRVCFPTYILHTYLVNENPSMHLRRCVAHVFPHRFPICFFSPYLSVFLP